MSVDRVDWTRAVLNRLTKRNPTSGKSLRERLRKIWQLGFSEGSNVGEPSGSETRLTKRDPVNWRSFPQWVSERVEMSADRFDRTRN